MFSTAKRKIVRFINESSDREVLYCFIIMVVAQVVLVAIMTLMVSDLYRSGFFSSDGKDLFVLRAEIKELKEDNRRLRELCD
jgi:hypothetical protein